jgi:hypothetical protein
VNRAMKNGSALPRCPASASILSARRFRWTIARQMIRNIRRRVSSGRHPRCSPGSMLGGAQVASSNTARL